MGGWLRLERGGWVVTVGEYVPAGWVVALWRLASLAPGVVAWSRYVSSWPVAGWPRMSVAGRGNGCTYAPYRIGGLPGRAVRVAAGRLGGSQLRTGGKPPGQVAHHVDAGRPVVRALPAAKSAWLLRPYHASEACTRRGPPRERRLLDSLPRPAGASLATLGRFATPATGGARRAKAARTHAGMMFTVRRGDSIARSRPGEPEQVVRG